MSPQASASSRSPSLRPQFERGWGCGRSLPDFSNRTSSCGIPPHPPPSSSSACSPRASRGDSSALTPSQAIAPISLSACIAQVRMQHGAHVCHRALVFEKWTHWGLSPGPSACEADVIPLHHVTKFEFRVRPTAFEHHASTPDLQNPTV